MRFLILFLIVFSFACQSENRKLKDISATHYESALHFKNEHHLFLNYYFGMSIADYEKATKKNFIEHQLFLSGEVEDCELNRFSHKHTKEDIDNISRHSVVYYEFKIGDEEFEAVLHPVFKYNRLAKIELQTLNCFNFGNHQHEFYRRKVNTTQQVLLDHHQKQYGKYQINNRKATDHIDEVIKTAGVSLDQFDTNRYVFNHQNKVVTIEQKCCDFKPIIVYTHKAFFDFLHDKTFEKELYHYWSDPEI